MLALRWVFCSDLKTDCDFCWATAEYARGDGGQDGDDEKVIGDSDISVARGGFGGGVGWEGVGWFL